MRVALLASLVLVCGCVLDLLSLPLSLLSLSLFFSHSLESLSIRQCYYGVHFCTTRVSCADTCAPSCYSHPSPLSCLVSLVCRCRGCPRSCFFSEFHLLRWLAPLSVWCSLGVSRLDHHSVGFCSALSRYRTRLFGCPVLFTPPSARY